MRKDERETGRERERARERERESERERARESEGEVERERESERERERAFFENASHAAARTPLQSERTNGFNYKRTGATNLLPMSVRDASARESTRAHVRKIKVEGGRERGR